MTATVERPPTVHRTRRRTAGNPFAEGVAARFEAGEAVTVAAGEYGPGWWITGVDRVARTFGLYRDGGEMTVAWAEVTQ